VSWGGDAEYEAYHERGAAMSYDEVVEWLRGLLDDLRAERADV